MAAISDIVTYLSTELQIEELQDYEGSLNGLQLENQSGECSKVAAAVDATLPVIEKTIATGAQLLIVHHGMFWNGAQPITGAVYQRIQTAIENDLAIYSAHLPLDIHPHWGNNALLSSGIGLDQPEPFLDWKGQLMALRGEMSLSREELQNKVQEATGHPAHLCPGGGEKAGMVAVITGGAGSEVAKLKAAGIDTFITGEGPHWSYTLAEELGINVIYGGHYATETFGVKKLAEVVAEKYEIEQRFIDHPSGL